VLYGGNNILGEPLLFPMIEVIKISLIFTKLSPTRYPKKCCLKNPNNFFGRKMSKELYVCSEDNKSSS